MKETEMVFATRELFRQWLTLNAGNSEGLWLIFSKTKTLITLSANEALEEALCFGWIDGVMQSIDKDKYRKYFARRREQSNWSEKNKKLAQSLIERGLMTPSGLDAITQAKKNGRWDSSKCTTISEEQIEAFKQLVRPHEPAFTHLSAMSHSVQRTYTGFYFEAKSDQTRQSRLEKILDRLNHNLKPMG